MKYSKADTSQQESGGAAGAGREGEGPEGDCKPKLYDFLSNVFIHNQREVSTAMQRTKAEDYIMEGAGESCRPECCPETTAVEAWCKCVQDSPRVAEDI